MHLPANTRLVITRPAGQADALQQALSDAGICYRHSPLLAIEPHPFNWPNGSADLTIFTSPNAVEYALSQQPATESSKLRFGKLLAIGSKTQNLLIAKTGLHVLAPDPMNSEGLLAMPELNRLTGKTVFLVKGEGGRDLLPAELEKRGAKLTILDCYRRRLLSPQTNSDADSNDSKIAEWWLISSLEAMQSLAESIPDAKIVVSSDRLSIEAKALGLQVMAQSRGASDDHWLALFSG